MKCNASHAITVSDPSGVQISFACNSGERILQAGLRAGIGLPHECASGTCGSCKVRLVAGEVFDLWPAAPGRKLARRDDEILTCQTTCLNSKGGQAIELAVTNLLATPPAQHISRSQGLLRKIEMLSAQVACFEINLDTPLRFEPGQFVLLDIPGIVGPRAYSMMQACEDTKRGTQILKLLVRHAAGGAATGRLFSASFNETRVDVFGPLGKAVYREQEMRPLVALAGGSGIAGLLAIIEAAGKVKHFEKFASALVFGLRDPNSSYLLDALDQLQGNLKSGLSITVAFSEARADAALKIRYPHLAFAEGHVHEAAEPTLDRFASSKPIYFVAGPPPMVDATMRELVIRRKVSSKDVRYDRFG